ncbi:MAG: FxsB family radical SAM/SPASM domain protein [Micromonosporaceae bacterium]|nr:FxsB family radical SAM/SPASM domain protein [Micromonosporaceae bacterium]
MSVGDPRRQDGPTAVVVSVNEPPFHQFVIKISEQCNLACDYCYMFPSGDQRRCAGITRMSIETVNQVADRLVEYLATNKLNDIQIVLHGGEPLLAGNDHIAYCVQRIRRAVGGATTLQLAIQTNGTLLNQRTLELLRELDVMIGVSLDGPEPAHDRHRRHHSGRGSYADVVKGLRALCSDRYRHLFFGLIAVVDLRNDPVETYQELLGFAPPVMDFLLPHGDWSTPPPGTCSGAAYGRWLAAVFDRWYESPVRETRVRVFGEIMSLLLGGGSRLEGIGTSPPGTVVIETDGGIEGSDLPTGMSAPFRRSGLHVASDAVELAARLPVQVAQRRGAAGLSTICRACALGTICGGGLYTHRYRSTNGNGNPSVYCSDLWYLISHIHRRMARDLERLQTRGQHRRPGRPGPGSRGAGESEAREGPA